MSLASLNTLINTSAKNLSQFKGLAVAYNTLLGGVPSIDGFTFLINENNTKNFGAPAGVVFNDENIYINTFNALYQGNQAAKTAFDTLLATSASVQDKLTTVYNFIVPQSARTTEGLNYFLSQAQFYATRAAELGIVGGNGVAVVAFAALSKIVVDADLAGIGDGVNDLVAAVGNGTAAIPQSSATFTAMEQADGTVFDGDDAGNLTPTFQLAPSAGSVNEGAAVTFTLTTTNVPNGAVVPYTITGVNAADVVGGQLQGNAVIQNGTATIVINLVADAATEGAENLVVSLDGKQVASGVIVNDTSVNSPVGPVSDTDGALGGSVQENAAAGTAVGVTASATDPNATDNVSYALTSNPGNLFAIDSVTGVITVAGAIDYEAATSFDVTVRATSTDGSFSVRTFTIAVTPVNDNPMSPVTDADTTANTVAENAAVGSAVGVTALATDADRDATVTYALGNNAGGRFAINPTTGVITVAGALDFETTTSHELVVIATSSDGSSRSQAFTVAVTNVNDNPLTAVTDSNAAANTVAEDVAVGSVVGVTAFASDADTGATVTYALVDNAGGRFAINATTGVVTVASPLDFETATSHNITVQATSSDGSPAQTQVFTINVTNVVELTPLTAGNDQLQGSATEGEVIIANAGTFQAGDTINGGGNNDGDRLVINDRLADQNFTNTRNIEIVELTSVNTPGGGNTDTVGIFAANAGVQTVRMTVQSEVDFAGFGNNLTVEGSVDSDVVAFSVADTGTKTMNLGTNVPNTLDSVTVNGATNDVRISFVTGEVGDGAANNATAPSAAAGTAYNGQAAGGLAVRLEEESATGAVTGEAGDNAASVAHRFEDEGILFTGAAFDVRDVASLANPGVFQAVALGTSGADTISAVALGLGASYVNAGQGNDTVTDTANADFLEGGAGNDTLNTTGGNDTAIGGTGLDTITATTGDDRLDGGAENDRIQFDDTTSLDANDTVIGGAGDADTLAITAGNVLDAQFAGVSTVEVLELSATAATQDATIDELAIAAGIRTVNGLGADNVVTLEQQHAAGLVAVSVNGGAGNDTVLVVNAVNNAPVAADQGSFNVTLSGVETFDASAATNGVVATATGATAVSFTGSVAADSLTGGGGNDLFLAGLGGDTIAGGASADLLNVEVTAGPNNSVVSASGIEAINFFGVSSVTVTDNTAATISMATGATVTAGGGNDIVAVNSSGAQSIAAGAGNDTITTFTDLAAAVTIDGGTGTNRIIVADAGVVDADFTNVTNVQELELQTTGAVGSTVTLNTEAFEAGITTVIGSSNLAPLAAGTSTDDDINVVSGAAATTRTLTIDGGEITANDDFDDVVVTGAGNVVLNVSNVEQVNGQAMTGALTVTASGPQSVVMGGGTAADSLTGSTGADTLVGGDGRDTLTGGGGDDTYVMSIAQFNTDLDTINEVAGGGTLDTLLLTSNVPAGIVDVGFNARFTNVERAQFRAEGGPQLFTASFGAFTEQTGLRTFEAQNGDAQLDLTFTNQFTGNVTVAGGAQGDRVEASGINGSVTYIDALGGGAGDTVTTGAQADTVTLIDGNNTVSTNGGADLITLGSGVDTVNAGAGADTIIGGSNVTDADSIVGGADVDTLTLRGNVTLTAASQFSGIETITLQTDTSTPLTGSFDYSLTVDNDNAPTAGNALSVDGSALLSAEMLEFSAAAVTTYGVSVTGGAAGDLILGGGSADTLTGGEGADTLVGGNGADVINLAETTKVRDVVVLRGTDPTLLGADVINGFDATNATLGARDMLELDPSLVTGAITVVTQGAQGQDFSANNVINITAAVPGGADTAVKVATFLQTSNLGAAGDKKVFIFNDGTNSYVWQYTGDANANVNASEFKNIAIINGVTNGLTTNEVRVDSILTTPVFTTLDDVKLLPGGATYDGLTGFDTLTLSSAGITLVSNIEQVTASAAGNGISTSSTSTLIGGAGADTLSGAAAVTVQMTGNGGSDRFHNVGGSTINVTDLETADEFGINGTMNATVTGAFVADGTDVNLGTVNITTNGFGVNMSAAAGGSNGFSVFNVGGAAVLVGSASADTLSSGAGNDTLTGGGGNDRFLVAGGTDTITDLSGSDVLVVSAGATAAATVTAAFTATAATANAGTANINANGFGVDLALASGPNGYNVTNSGGAATITGSAQNDTIAGGAAGDVLSGGNGTDSISGGGGTDSITGGVGNDTLLGEAGADTLTGGADNDTMTGGLDDDRFVVDSGTDTVTDLSGNDDVQISPLATLNGTVTGNWAVTGASFNIGTANITTNGFNVDLNAVIGGVGFTVTNIGAAATITGSGSADTINAGIGGDSIVGGGGTDSITGGLGTDDLLGGNGNDTLLGGDNDDTLTGGADNDTMTGGAGVDTFNVDAGSDTITDLSGTDVLVVSNLATATVTVTANWLGAATSANDGTASLTTAGFSVDAALVSGANGLTITNTGAGTTLTGTIQGDTITGGTGVDNLSGGDGTDRINGGDGNDAINGGNGADTITGGSGEDAITLTADNASDQVIYGALLDLNATDTITDFDANGGGQDLIGFTGAVRTALDDNTNNALNFTASNLIDGGNEALSAGNEATVLVDAEVEITATAFGEPGLIQLLGELNEEIDFSGIATGQEHLFVVNVSATQAGLVYYTAANGGDDVVTAAEFKVIGVVTHDAAADLTTASFGLV